jgi:hypothetical protein
MIFHNGGSRAAPAHGVCVCLCVHTARLAEVDVLFNVKLWTGGACTIKGGISLK